MGVFQGSCFQQHHEQLPAPPACRGEQRGLGWVLGSFFSTHGSSLPWAHPHVFLPPFSNASHTKVSKELLAMSITACKQVLQGAIAR